MVLGDFFGKLLVYGINNLVRLKQKIGDILLAPSYIKNLNVLHFIDVNYKYILYINKFTFLQNFDSKSQ